MHKYILKYVHKVRLQYEPGFGIPCIGSLNRRKVLCLNVCLNFLPAYAHSKSSLIWINWGVIRINEAKDNPKM
jgi:hypothetical protein